LRSALVEAFLDFETSGAVFMATTASGGFLLGVVRFLCRIDRLDRIVGDGFF
jgi:hypothetical protein